MRSRAIRALVCTALGACALLPPSAASAFCRTTTVPVAPDFNPTPTQCWSQGVPLFHRGQCVTYQLAKEASSLPNGAISEALARGFSSWITPNATCSPGITPIELAPTDREMIVEYVSGGPNVNLVGVPKQWAHAGPSAGLSLTTLTFNPETGEVKDADMEINGAMPWSFAAGVAQDGYDLETILLHEAGHFLGLAHAADDKAVMYANYAPGSTRRALTSDDQSGICAIYPRRGERAVLNGKITTSTACDLSPTAGGACGDPAISHGCAAAPWPRGSASSAAWVAGCAAIAALLSRRIRSRRRATRG